MQRYVVEGHVIEGRATRGRVLNGCARRRVLPRLFRGDECGQGMLEYAIIGGVIIVGAVAVLSALSGNLNHIFTAISNTLGQY